MEKINCLIFPFLFAAIIWAGCATQKPDPLAGWHFCSLNDLDSNKAVTDDYRNYIQRLSPNDSENVGVIKYFQDGTGQHAVKIEIGLKGTWWEHVLIYNKDNERIKTLKYSSGHYAS